MLFDLRSRGRRNVVKGVYSFLAVLMGAGLVLFGIGGATSGGLLNAFNGKNGSSTSPTKTIKAVEATVRRDPTNTAAWDRLAKLRYQFVIADANNIDASSNFTAAGKAQLAGVVAAWNRYLALKPAKLDQTLAKQMEGVFSPQALNQPDNVVKTIETELAATKKPTEAQYEIYSVYATQAGQTRKAKLAQQQAESLAAAGKTGKARKTAIAGVRQNIAAGTASLSQASGATQTAPAAATTTTG